jgi:hypothetical protein
MNATRTAWLLSTLLASATGHAQTLQGWMSPDVKQAWTQGYKGQGVTIQVIDDFTSTNRYYGNLGTGTLLQRHGEWTRQEAGMVAPSATVVSTSFSTNATVALAKGLNVLNLSYGMMAANGYANSQIGWDRQESSIIAYAKNGSAVVAKAAGNDAVAVNGVNSSGLADYLNRALIGSQTGLFVGALDKNGTTTAKASLAWYSNYAGTDVNVQNKFLVVGVEGSKTGLYGTSFAAPVISGYSAVLGSKFTAASATQITNQLLNTARTDTITNYNKAVHGRGEASLSRALAPVAIR